MSSQDHLGLLGPLVSRPKFRRQVVAVVGALLGALAGFVGQFWLLRSSIWGNPLSDEELVAWSRHPFSLFIGLGVTYGGYRIAEAIASHMFPDTSAPVPKQGQPPLTVGGTNSPQPQTAPATTDVAPPNGAAASDKAMSPTVARVADWLATNARLFLGEYQGRVVYTDGRFLAVADTYPPEVASVLQVRKCGRLPASEIEAAIPKDMLRKGAVVTAVADSPDRTENEKKVTLTAGSVRVVADALYYAYLRERYPTSVVLVTTNLDPIVFMQDDQPVAVLMPMRS